MEVDVTGLGGIGAKVKGLRLVSLLIVVNPGAY